MFVPARGAWARGAWARGAQGESAGEESVGVKSTGTVPTPLPLGAGRRPKRLCDVSTIIDGGGGVERETWNAGATP